MIRGWFRRRRDAVATEEAEQERQRAEVRRRQNAVLARLRVLEAHLDDPSERPEVPRYDPLHRPAD